MYFVPAGLSGDSVVQIFLYHGEPCLSVILSFVLLGSKYSQEKEKETKLAEAWKFSLTAI